jgi:hypothetical protein
MFLSLGDNVGHRTIKMRYENRVFSPVDRIEVDGAEIIGCDLGGCTLVYRGGEPPSMINNKGAAPKLVFEGAAGNTVAFMKGLSQGGMGFVIRNTFPGLFGN